MSSIAHGHAIRGRGVLWVRMPQPPVLFADFCPYPCTRRTQPYGQPPPAVRQPSYPAARSAHGALGGCPGFVWIAWVACACPFGAATAASWVHQPRPVRVRNDPGASELAWGWAHTRTSLGMCWSRYVLLGPGSSFASGPSGMAEMPNRRSFQGCSAKHRVCLVSTRDGFRTLPTSLKTWDGRCTAFLGIVHESG